MKKLFITIILAIVFTGCTQLNTAMDIVDIFTEPTPVHYAEVQSITKSKEGTTLFFVDGYNYKIDNSVYVKPGDMAKIFKEDDGGFSAEVD